MKHKADCRMAFGRKDLSCPRCQGLLAGAPVKQGWGSTRRESGLRVLQAIRAHDCKASGCGPVCTAFEW